MAVTRFLSVLCLSVFLMGQGFFVGNRRTSGPQGFFDDFDTFDTERWTELTSGTGDCVQSASQVACTAGTGAALFYLNRQVDLTVRNQFWLGVRFDGTDALDVSLLALNDDIPVIGGAAGTKTLVRNQNADVCSDCMQMQYRGASVQSWRQSTEAWSTGPYASMDRFESGYLTVQVIETRPNGGTEQFRMLTFGPVDDIGTAWSSEQGWQLDEWTPWVNFSSLTSNTGEFYVTIGEPDTDRADDIEVEWFAHLLLDEDDLDDSRYAYINWSETAGTPLIREVALFYSIGVPQDMGWYLPYAQDPVVIAEGGVSDPDDEQAARPSIVKDGPTYYMAYDCHDGTDWQICGATASDPEGSWTKESSVLISDGGVNDSWSFPHLDYDAGETDEWQLWIGEGAGGDGNQGVYHADSNAFGTGWSTPTQKIADSTASSDWFSTYINPGTMWEGSARPEFWVQGYDGTVWQSGCFYPDGSDRYTATWDPCEIRSGSNIGAVVMEATRFAEGTADDPTTTTDANSTGCTLNVTSTDDLPVGSWIVIGNASVDHMARVVSVNAGVSVDVDHCFSDIDSGIAVRQSRYWSPTMRSFAVEGDKVRFHGTVFRWALPSSEMPLILQADAGYLPSMANWTTIDEPWGAPIAPMGFSTENAAFIREPISTLNKTPYVTIPYPQHPWRSPLGIQADEPFTMAATAVDDSLPNPPNAMTYKWTTDCTGVTWGDDSSLTTTFESTTAQVDCEVILTVCDDSEAECQ